MKRANALLAAGAVLLIIGVVVVATWGRGDDDAADDGNVTVLVARSDLESGELGDDLLAAGKVSVQEVPRSSVEQGALTSTAAMAGLIVTADVAEDQQVTTQSVGPANLRQGSITIPDDKQAVAVTVDFTAAGAGYIGTGDHVNLYAVISPGAPGAPSSPLTKLLLSDVEVLDVSNELAPRRSDTAASTESDASASPRATEGQFTLLLALSAQDAEQAIFANAINDLWVTLLPEDQGASTTDGVTYAENYVGSN